MKYRLFSFFVLLNLLGLLSSAGSVRAQSPLPPEPTPPPYHGPQEYPAGGLEAWPQRFSSGVASAGDMAAQALALGPSGLSFRYLKTFGTTQVAYLADHTHLNYPWGLGSQGNNIWIGELWGNRALKYTNAGAFQQQLGIAGFADLAGTALAEIVDVAADAGGNIWVVDEAASHVAKFNSSGAFVKDLGVLGQQGTDISHFLTPASIAFDAAGNMYVSDGAPWYSPNVGNHRIQIFGSTGSYLASIGETGVTGTGNDHFYGPKHIATYGNGLYVADAGNHRVQIFNIATPASPAYVATLGVSGVSGSDNAHFDNPSGVAVDTDYIYVADTFNNRVQVFNRLTRAYVQTIGGTWGTANNQFENPTDVAVDAGHTLYVADFVNLRVQQFTHVGATFTFARTYGVTGVPYLTDGNHFNHPSGVTVAADGSIYVTETLGHRLIKLNASGIPLWTVGAAGVRGDWNNANNRFDDPADVAVDTSGHVFVGDRWHGRVQIYNASDGSFNATISGLNCPGGVHIAPNGFLYVADSCDSAIKIYDTSHSLVGTIGVVGVSGSDNDHFNYPQDVAVDGVGTIYVADQGNHRVQVFNSSLTYVRTIGTSGVCGGSYDQLCGADALAVDGSDRVYVADLWNNRVQVFSPSGAYLTTMGGNWGPGSGELRSTTAVAVDAAGNVYIADWENDRIQKFARGIPGWTQSNLNGFGDRWLRNGDRLAVFGGKLYAGGGLDSTQIWTTADGSTWSPLGSAGFGDLSNAGIADLTEFNGNFYASTWNCTNSDCSTSNGGQVWRTDGSTWSKVVNAGFANTNNSSINTLQVFSSQIYAAVTAINGVLKIYRSSTGDAGSWSAVVSNGFGSGGVHDDLSMDIYGGYLYLGFGRSGVGELWRTNNGTTWSPVFTNGLAPNNSHVASMAVFNGAFYIGMENATNGGELWKSTNGTTFTRVFAGGLGKAGNERVSGLYVVNGSLQVIFDNFDTGAEVWRSPDGATWTQVGYAGWGDANNIIADRADKGTVAFAGRLYIGTLNLANGAEVWSTLLPHTVSLPSIGAQDGWILESGENTNTGGSLNATATTFQLGDDAANKQYRAILSFNTTLPAGAVVQSAVLKIKQSGRPTGTNPFSMLGNLLVDIRQPYFGTTNALQLGDFNIAASALKVGTFNKVPSGGWYSAPLNATGQGNINKVGLTQFRLYFSLDDNNNHLANFMQFLSGNYATALSRPQLIITYTVP